LAEPLHEGGEGPAEGRVDGGDGVRVAAGLTLVDDHDGDAQPGGLPDEPVAGHHGQRGPENDQRGRAPDKGVALVHARPWHVLAEEHHVGLEQSAAPPAVHDVEALDRRVPEHRVAIRVDHGDLGRPAGVCRPQPLVKLGAGGALPA